MKKFTLQILTLVVLITTVLSGCQKDLGNISGTITDGLTGQPITKADVTLSGASTGQTTTADNGIYQFANLIPGVHRISVNKPGYRQNSIDVTVSWGSTGSGSLLLQPNSSTSTITISETNLDFGLTSEELPVTLTNNSSVDAQYSTAISPTNSWLSVNPNVGTINAKGFKSIGIRIDRSKITSSGEVIGTVIVSIPNLGSIPPINVRARKQ